MYAVVVSWSVIVTLQTSNRFMTQFLLLAPWRVWKIFRIYSKRDLISTTYTVIRDKGKPYIVYCCTISNMSAGDQCHLWFHTTMHVKTQKAWANNKPKQKNGFTQGVGEGKSCGGPYDSVNREKKVNDNNLQYNKNVIRDLRSSVKNHNGVCDGVSLNVYGRFVAIERKCV